ncbi:MAG: NAD-dependent epimerase/dehydratase family protein [Bacteroidia bacterium]|nr:NAD-dependent epimerase/dehydratase family protein [Bacteroidia bacterium]
MSERVLVIGSNGQIGTELVAALRLQYGQSNVIASDLKLPLVANEPFATLDALDKTALYNLVKKENITIIYLLAAMLSATAEQQPAFAWKLNMESLFNVLELAKEKHIKQIYWPSSIAVFGPTTPRTNTPQYTIMEPSTIYGISKQTGERWCEWYYNKHQVDVRSLRYPGLISYTAAPGGGTTDYAVHIFYEARKNNTYTSFLDADTALPMLYMDDAIRATLEIMNADSSKIKIRSAYNIGGISFTPAQIATEIQKHIPNFTINYMPDFRQQIANSWPQSIDDSYASNDWGWKHKYNLQEIVGIMLANIK